MRRQVLTGMAASAGLGLLLGACATVKVETDKPIEINLNVTVRQEIVVKLEKDVQDLLKQNPNIF